MPALPDGSDLIGGHLALDFVNTVSWRGDPRRTVDRLPDFAALLAWAARSGALDPAVARSLARAARRDPAAAESALRAARQLRETLHAVLAAVVDGGAPDLAALRPVLVDAVRHAALAPALPLHWTVPVDTPGDVPRRLTLAALDLLSDGAALSAVRRCEGAGCGWLFLDRSRSHTRRWCSTADCGNRERARRHYARVRAAAR
jgi:predicted RNA-binding Zn ribbon-like protein